MAIMAAPLTTREEAMSTALKTGFNRAASGPSGSDPSNGITAEFNRAAGNEPPGGSSGGKKAERPESANNIEPSIQDKKAGAMLDKGADRTARHGRAPSARTMTRSGYDLSR